MFAPLTGPLGPCCTRSGTVPHSGAARGTTEQIAGLTTYVARPAAPHAGGERVIMHFADVFGPLYLNGQLAMDYWAEHGASAELWAWEGVGVDGARGWR